jgi:hypothetical protein
MELASISKSTDDAPIVTVAVQIQRVRRLNKAGKLVFWGIRSAVGTSAEVTVREDELPGSCADVSSLLPGDVVTITGCCERASSRLSILATDVSLVEKWASTHPKQFVSLPKWYAEQWEPVVLPAVILQHETTHSSRLDEYVRAKLINAQPSSSKARQHPSAKNKSLMFVAGAEADQWAAQFSADTLARTDSALARVVSAVYLVQAVQATLASALESIHELIASERAARQVTNDEGASPSLRIRVRGFPRHLEKPVVQAISTKAQATVAPKDVDCVVAVVFDGLRFFVGLACTQQLLSASTAETSGTSSALNASGAEARALSTTTGDAAASSTVFTCHAYYKLREAFERFDLRLDCCNPSSIMSTTAASNTVVLDVGASPGGWTSYLCEIGCPTVVAIDPAPLAPEVTALDSVEYMQGTFEAALPILLQRGESGQRISCIVCDANFAPGRTVGMVEALVPALQEGALLVLTFKDHSTSRINWEEEKVKQLRRLEAICGGVSFIQLQLLANKRECTCIGRFKREVASGASASTRSDLGSGANVDLHQTGPAEQAGGSGVAEGEKGDQRQRRRRHRGHVVASKDPVASKVSAEPPAPFAPPVGATGSFAGVKVAKVSSCSKGGRPRGWIAAGQSTEEGRAKLRALSAAKEGPPQK